MHGLFIQNLGGSAHTSYPGEVGLSEAETLSLAPKAPAKIQNVLHAKNQFAKPRIMPNNVKYTLTFNKP